MPPSSPVSTPWRLRRSLLLPPRQLNLQSNRAMAAVKRLVANKDDTEQVFELMRALAGSSMSRGYRRLLTTPDGGQIAYEREEFADSLSDRA